MYIHTQLFKKFFSRCRQSTAGLKGATKKEAESCLQSVLEEVNAELSISKAPKLNHPSLVPAKEMMVNMAL